MSNTGPAPDERRCTATSKNTGNRCGAYAVAGHHVCKHHGAGAPQVKRIAKRNVAQETVMTEAKKLGMTLGEVDPVQAIMALIGEAAANVSVLRRMLHPEDAPPSANDLVEINYRTGASETTAIVELYERERDRLGRYAKLALDAGVEERRVRLAERTAGAIGDVLEAVVSRLELTDSQRKQLPDIVMQEMSRLEE